MRLHDRKGYINFFRMSPQLFDKLLSLVGPHINKKHVVRAPISATIRLQITLRYFAAGDNPHSLAYLFRVSNKTITNIIEETSVVIWSCLKPVVFPTQFNEFTWRRISARFDEIWNFPHCIGCVDSKLITMEAQPHTGSFYYDYKGHHSIHLQAYADADQKFIMVEIGAAGRQTDGGVFNNSTTGQLLKNNELNVPSPEPLTPGGVNLPYIFLGDEAFALSNFMLRPYPRSSELDLTKKVFNYRLSRARRIVESAFGTLSSVWRIFKDDMKISLPIMLHVVKACVYLHNFLIIFNAKGERYEMEISCARDEDSLHDISDNQGPNNKMKVTTMRDHYAHYFMNEGAVDFQWEKAVICDF